MIHMVTATTVEYHDNGANSRKFYRAHVFGTYVVFQWGRIDSVGQFSGASYYSPNAARVAADVKINEKINSGYGRMRQQTFDYDDRAASLVIGNKDTLKPLDSAFRRAAGAPTPAAPAPQPTPTPAPVPTPSPVLQDRHAEFTARALAAVSLAATDQPAALLELALLRDQWDELAQIHARAASYLETLNTMLLTPAASWRNF